MATQKPLYFDGRQLHRASPSNPIDSTTLNTDVVITNGLRPFVAPIGGVPATADTHLTTRRDVDRRIADSFWGGPVEAIRNSPPPSPLAEQRWIVGTTPTGAWAGYPNTCAAWRNSAWVFIPVMIGAVVFNKATLSHLHFNGTTWSPWAGTGTVVSVGLVLPSEFAVTFSPVTGTGDLVAEWAPQGPSKVLAGPAGVPGDPDGIPVFRDLVASDIPVLDWSHIGSGLPTTLAGYGITDAVAQGAVGGSGLTMETGRILGRFSPLVGAIEEIAIGAGLVLAAGVLSCTASSALDAGQVGFGDISNTLSGSNDFTYDLDNLQGGLRIGNVTPATDVDTGALVVSGGAGITGDLYVGGSLNLPSQVANTVFAAPSGAAGIPGFRALVADDIPGVAPGKITMNTARLLGRTTADPGGAEEITVGTGLSLAAGALTCTVAPSLADTQVGFGSPAGILSGSPNLTYNSTLSGGGLTIANTTDSSSTTTGALIVAGGIGVAKSVVAGRALLGNPITFIGGTTFSVGVYATSGTGNSKFALYGYSILTGGGAQNAGLYGFATASGGTPVRQIGLIGKSNDFAGVTSAIIGVYGGGDYTSSPNAIYSTLPEKSTIGVMGVRTTSAVSSGYVTNIGIYGEASGATNNYAGYFVGDILTIGTITARVAATQDSVRLQGRAGGTSSFIGTLTPTTLGASRTYTLPDKDGTVAMTSDIVAPSLTDTQVGFGSSSNLLSGSANLTYASTPATGGLTIANTTAATSTTTGALVVAGGIGIGGAGFFGGEVSATEAYRFFGTTKSVVGDNASVSAIVAVALGGGSTVAKSPSATGIAAIAIGGSESGTNGSRAFGLSSIAIGGGDSTNNGAYAQSSYSIAIGSASHAGSDSSSPGSIAIGRNSNVTNGGGGGGIAIGVRANNTSVGEGICIGSSSSVSGIYAFAIGRQSSATQLGSIGLGAFSSSTHTQGVAIGNNAATTKANQIVLGDATNHTEVKIPTTTASTSTTTGALVVSGGVGVSGAVYVGGLGNFGSASTVAITFGAGGIAAPANVALRALSTNTDFVSSAAVFGRAASTSSNGRSKFGVIGLATVGFGDRADELVGVYGRVEVVNTAHPVLAIGVEGYATTTSTPGSSPIYGVRGTGVATGAANTQGVYGGSFTATGAAASATVYGIYATASGGVLNYAGYFDTGLVKIAGTTASTSASTGALVVSGGIGVAGAIHAGSDLISGGAVYLGETGTDGSWRMSVSGTDLLIQRRESGSWVTKSTIPA